MGQVLVYRCRPHFFFAWVLVINGAAYLSYSIASRHVAHDLTPTRSDWRSLGRSIVDHLHLRHPRGEAARRYNVLQKLSYIAVIFVLLPLIVLTGWSMSPWLNSVWPGWVDVFGSRQSARTLHFIVAWLLVLFLLIHVVRSDCDRVLEQPALDDHRPLSGRSDA